MPRESTVIATSAPRDERTRLIYPSELPSIMRKHIYTGAMGTMHFVLLSGIYLVTFGNAIGLEHWQWAALGTASSFALVLQLLSAYLVGRIGARRQIWFVTALCSRTLRGAALALAFWLSQPLPGVARATFIILLVAANSLGAISAPPWMSWLADIIPEEDHGHFIGRRQAWISLANILVILPVGLTLDRLPEDLKVPALLAVFAFGLLIGIADLFIHRTIPEPPMVMPPQRRFWHEVAAPLADPTFRPWLVFTAAWTFSMTLGGSLAAVHFVENLGIRRNFLGAASCSSSCPFWVAWSAGSTSAAPLTATASSGCCS